ncbi:type VI secretion system contractile sheath large subunit [Microbulbifer elongatus]|uniref:Type VI secretion system contractile sheath large subunit n=1 Tax=Microbulbifer elongatus TaxID=86173 RepID=A0ABT1NZC1_9GAMM|nr:type VI secretion system contractile sheath large subunit [Microbulbifer elongatus]MCQ3829220.1 type VI secretion system contractile sheath large subunit [Microbulbifer elongatus]
MSRASMQTGAAIFSAGEESGGGGTRYHGASFRVAIVGDFSGRASRALCEPETLAQRQAYRLGKDNFEQLFERLQVRLNIPGMDEPLQLLEFDDLHPDYLYQRVPLFKKFIELEKQLLSSNGFADAAEEIRQWRPELLPSDITAPTAPRMDGADGAQSMLDRILSGEHYQSLYQEHTRSSATGQIDLLIKDIVAPYLQKKPDANQAAYLDAVTEAASEAMRKIMHHSDFRQLEASWRSLHMLLRRLEDHPGLEIHLLDISKEEVLADFAQAEDDLECSGLFKCLVERHTTAGSKPYDLILGDYFVSDEERDLHMLIDLATIAEAAGSTLILGGDCRLAGCPSMAGSMDPDDWCYPLSEAFSEGWRALRAYPACEHVALAAPRFLLRMPFGADASRTETFAFEELSPELGHRYYLWGNSAYLLALSICSAFSAQGVPTVVPADQYTGLPVHLRKLPHGEWLTPCAEAWMTDRAAARFNAAGLSALRSVQGRDEIVLPRLQSLAGTTLRGAWQ